MRVQGVEHDLFDADANVIGRSENHAGDVSGLAPPGDIHRGTDVTRIGTSARRCYD